MSRLTTLAPNNKSVQDAVGEALMDFAEAAELAELEDQQMEEMGHHHPGTMPSNDMSEENQADALQPGCFRSMHEIGEDLACHRSEEPMESLQESIEGMLSFCIA